MLGNTQENFSRRLKLPFFDTHLEDRWRQLNSVFVNPESGSCNESRSNQLNFKIK